MAKGRVEGLTLGFGGAGRSSTSALLRRSNKLVVMQYLGKTGRILPAVFAAILATTSSALANPTVTVPDAGSTALMLAGALGGLLILGRRMRRQQ
jgi:hypothetical protein